VAIRYPAAAPLSHASPFWSRQLHDWQSYEGPVNRRLVPPGPGHPRPLVASPLGWWSGGGVEGRVQVADSEVEFAFLRACIYISLIPQLLSSNGTMASLYAECFRELFFSQPFDIFSPIQQRVISPGARWQQTASTARFFTSLLWRRVPILRVPILRVPSLPAAVFGFGRGTPLQRSLWFLCTHRCRRMRTILNAVALGSHRPMLS
jgi:hypothetical protein